MKKQKDKKILSEPSLLERFSISATRKVGSIPSLILHTIGFIGIFSLQFFGFTFDQIMLILTTIVSLEAIYLSIFIQMTVNRQAETLSEVSEDVEDIQEDVEDIQEDVEGIEKEVKEIGTDVDDINEDVDTIHKHVKDIREDVEDIQEDVEEISEDVEGIEKEVKEIGTDVDEISEDVEDISEEMAADETAEEKEKAQQVADMKNIEHTLRELLKAIEQMKK